MGAGSTTLYLQLEHELTSIVFHPVQMPIQISRGYVCIKKGHVSDTSGRSNFGERKIPLRGDRRVDDGLRLEKGENGVKLVRQGSLPRNE